MNSRLTRAMTSTFQAELNTEHPEKILNTQKTVLAFSVNLCYNVIEEETREVVLEIGKEV